MKLTKEQIKEFQTCIALWNEQDEDKWLEANNRCIKSRKTIENAPVSVEGTFKYKFNVNLVNFEEDLCSMLVVPTEEELQEDFKEYIITDLIDTLRNQLNGELSAKDIAIKIDGIPIDVNGR